VRPASGDGARGPLWLVGLAALVAGLVWLVRRVWGGSSRTRPSAGDSPMDILRRLAQNIIRDQEREIEVMEGWRKAWGGEEVALPRELAVNWHRAVQLTAGLAEHAVAALGRLAGRRYFDGAYFDRVYAKPDPWGYAASLYEAARREAVLAALPRRRYRSVLEVGCGEGYLTRLLAERADRVVGIDVSDSAVALARSSSPPANVRMVRGDLLGHALPPEARAGGFDLVVCTEVLYYCYRLPIGPACRVARDRLVGWLAWGGDLVVQHPHHYPFHRPFDRLCERRLLTGIERRSVALAPRPVSIAVYRRGEDRRHQAPRSAVTRRPDARVRRPAEGGRS